MKEGEANVLQLAHKAPETVSERQKKASVLMSDGIRTCKRRTKGTFMVEAWRTRCRKGWAGLSSSYYPKPMAPHVEGRLERHGDGSTNLKRAQCTIQKR